MTTLLPNVVAREVELGALRAFLGVPGRKAMLISGQPGIGKTTLWMAGIDQAAAEGYRVLSARPAEAETRLSLAALSDLLEPVSSTELDSLPAPQRVALEIALLRAEPGRRPPEPRAIAAGLVGVLRGLSQRDRLLVAIDDAPWLDRASAAALAFAIRRLDDQPITYLLTARSGPRPALERELEPAIVRLVPGGLSFGAARRLLHERLGLDLPRRTLQRAVEATGGNPLLLLEIGRVLATRDASTDADDLPVPDSASDLLGVRVESLPPATRRVLLAVALNSGLRPVQLERVADGDAVADAIRAGVVVFERDRARASHPLLAAAARAGAADSERRAMHTELAGIVENDELAARHLALATTSPDAELAATVEAAATVAAARGSVSGAAELSEHALRLTPQGSPERPRRLVALADVLMVAGEADRASDLLLPELQRLPSGPVLARAHLLLAERRSDVQRVDEAGVHYERAMEESRGDPVLHAIVSSRRALDVAVARVERVAEAESWAAQALEAAHDRDPDAEREALSALAWTRLLRGLPIDDLRRRFDAIEGSTFAVLRSLDRIAADRLALRGDIASARVALTQALAVADERGELWSHFMVRLQLCELELRSGHWEAAEQLLDAWDDSAEQDLVADRAYDRCRAHLAAGRGDAAEAERWATCAEAGMTSNRFTWHLLETARARGVAALLAREPDRASRVLLGVWEHTEREGVEEPAAFPVAPDLVEALTDSGMHDDAQAVCDRLAQLGRRQEHPWALAGAARCAGLVGLAAGTDVERSAALLRSAADAYDGMGLAFDRTRTLLTLGRGLRRHRKWGEARRALELAAAAFDSLGSPGWSDDARSELARVGARRPSADGALTPAERRVAELAARGLSNKEIATHLVVSVNTVESHLKRSYAKLGIRSRSQLSGAISS